MAILNAKANSSYTWECRFEGVVHRCRKVQLVKRHIWGRGQYHDGYSRDNH